MKFTKRTWKIKTRQKSSGSNILKMTVTSGAKAILMPVLILAIAIQPNSIAKSQSLINDHEFSLLTEMQYYKRLAMEAVKSDLMDTCSYGR